MRRVLTAFFIALAILVALVGLTHQGRVAVKAALFIPEVLPQLPVHPQRWFVREPSRTQVNYPIESGQGVADLYQPAHSGKHGAVLLFLGVSPAGRDDPRVVGLADGLARAGMVVLIPWSANMTQERVDPADIDNLVRAFQYLRALPAVDRSRVGMGGFCVGSSFALVAAADARIRDEVSFVNDFGGYYDAFDFLKAISTGQSFYDGLSEPWQPDSLTRRVFTSEIISGLPDQAERDLLARRFLDGDASAAIDAGSLSPPARAVFRLLIGPSLQEVDSLVAQLSQRTQDTLRRISPSTYVSDLKARVLIMVDREDALVPSEESQRLDDALAKRGNVYYTQFSFFKHVDANRRVAFPTFVHEAAKLYLHMYHILEAGA